MTKRSWPLQHRLVFRKWNVPNETAILNAGYPRRGSRWRGQGALKVKPGVDIRNRFLSGVTLNIYRHIKAVCVHWSPAQMADGRKKGHCNWRPGTQFPRAAFNYREARRVLFYMWAGDHACVSACMCVCSCDCINARAPINGCGRQRWVSRSFDLVIHDRRARYAVMNSDWFVIGLGQCENSDTSASVLTTTALSRPRLSFWRTADAFLRLIRF